MTEKTAAIALALTLAVSSFGAGSADAAADPGANARYDNCQRLKDNNRWNWSGVATGSVYGRGGKVGRTGFHIRSCHATKSSCRQWVRNVHREIGNIDILRSARCISKQENQRLSDWVYVKNGLVLRSSPIVPPAP